MIRACPMRAQETPCSCHLRAATGTQACFRGKTADTLELHSTAEAPSKMSCVGCSQLTQHHATSRNITQPHTTSLIQTHTNSHNHNVTPPHATSRNITQHHTAPRNNTEHNETSHNLTQRRTVVCTVHARAASVARATRNDTQRHLMTRVVQPPLFKCLPIIETQKFQSLNFWWCIFVLPQITKVTCSKMATDDRVHQQIPPTINIKCAEQLVKEKKIPLPKIQHV